MKNKGFAFIELLVVIAIIGILTSIVITSISEARCKTDKRKCDNKEQVVQKEDKFTRNNTPSTTNISDTQDISECGVECQKQIYSNKMIEECISRYAYKPTN